MKAYIILVVIGASLGASTLLYLVKTRQPDEIDRFSNTLMPVTSYLPAGARINIRTEPSKSELLPWARYTLAPVFLSPEPDYDTTLCIQYLQNGDSSLNAFVVSQRQVWQARNSQYIYTLTIHQP